MANKTSFTKIGMTVIVGVAAIVLAFIYFGGMRGKGPTVCFETYYTKGVSGLSVGSAVNIRGVKVGEVKEISFIGSQYDDLPQLDTARIYILMEVDYHQVGYDDEEIPATRREEREFFESLVKMGLRATVTSSGITGLSRMELDFYPPEEASPIEELAWTPENIYIPAQFSFLDSFSDSATKVMNQINKMDIETISSNISAAVDSIARSTETLRTMMDVRQADLEKICDDLEETTANVRDLAAEVKRNPSLLLRERLPRRVEETE